MTRAQRGFTTRKDAHQAEQASARGLTIIDSWGLMGRAQVDRLVIESLDAPNLARLADWALVELDMNARALGVQA